MGHVSGLTVLVVLLFVCVCCVLTLGHSAPGAHFRQTVALISLALPVYVQGHYTPI